MSEELESKNALVISYLTLRKIIGFLGISFPVVLFLVAVIFFQTGLQSSVSKYYHTVMGDVFVGTLCVIGFFLLSYKGYEHDYIAGRLGCILPLVRRCLPLIKPQMIKTLSDTFTLRSPGCSLLPSFISPYSCLRKQIGSDNRKEGSF